jgi:hypothetical protein
MAIKHVPMTRRFITERRYGRRSRVSISCETRPAKGLAARVNRLGKGLATFSYADGFVGVGREPCLKVIRVG